MKHFLSIVSIVLSTHLLLAQNFFSQTKLEYNGDLYHSQMIGWKDYIVLANEGGDFLKAYNIYNLESIDFNEKHSLNPGEIYDIAAGKDNLWILRSNDLLRINENEIEILSNNIQGETITSIAEDDQNRLFVGTENALYRYTNGNYNLIVDGEPVYQLTFATNLYALNNNRSVGQIRDNSTRALMMLDTNNEWQKLNIDDVSPDSSSMTFISLRPNANQELVISGRDHVTVSGTKRIENSFYRGSCNSCNANFFQNDTLWITEPNWYPRGIKRITGEDTTYFSYQDGVIEPSDLILYKNKVVICTSDQNAYSDFLLIANSNLDAINGIPNPKYLDIGKIKAGFYNGNPAFMNTSNSTPSFEIDNTGAHGMFASSPIISAIDEDGKINVIHDRFGDNNKLINGTLTIPQGSKRPFAIKLDKSTIENHKKNFSKLGYKIPESIKNWPANGIESLGEDKNLAPYRDVNNNNIYDPEKGDYPLIIGDQMIYKIINYVGDNSENSQTNTKDGLNIEIHCAYFAFADVTDNKNQNMYVNFYIRNKSEENYPYFKFGNFQDFDLGFPYDDYIGSDSTYNQYYVYNGDSVDDVFAGSPGFGENPPMLGVKHLSHALDAFVYYNSGAGLQGDPFTALDYHRYLRGRWKDDSPIILNGEEIKLMFNGDPYNQTGFTEAMAGNAPQDRRAIAAFPELSLEANGAIAYTMVYGFAYPDGVKSGNGYLSAYPKLTKQLQSAGYYLYNSGVIPEEWEHRFATNVVGIEEQVKGKNMFTLFPNPTDDKIFIKGEIHKISRINLFAPSGRLIKSFNDEKDFENHLNLSELKSGTYILQLELNNGELNTQLISIK